MLKENFIATQKAGSAKIILKMIFELIFIVSRTTARKNARKKRCFQKKTLEKIPTRAPNKKILALLDLLQHRKIT